MRTIMDKIRENWWWWWWRWWWKKDEKRRSTVCDALWEPSRRIWWTWQGSGGACRLRSSTTERSSSGWEGVVHTAFRSHRGIGLDATLAKTTRRKISAHGHRRKLKPDKEYFTSVKARIHCASVIVWSADSTINRRVLGLPQKWSVKTLNR